MIRSITSSARLAELRQISSRFGIPFEFADRITLRPIEVARTTGIRIRKVRELIATERLPAYKVDGVVIVPVVDLLEFLEAHQHVGTRSRTASLQERADDFIDGLS